MLNQSSLRGHRSIYELTNTSASALISTLWGVSWVSSSLGLTPLSYMFRSEYLGQARVNAHVVVIHEVDKEAEDSRSTENLGLKAEC
jgi:hypothetical protein